MIIFVTNCITLAIVENMTHYRKLALAFYNGILKIDISVQQTKASFIFMKFLDPLILPYLIKNIT